MKFELYRSRKQKADEYKYFQVPVNVDPVEFTSDTQIPAEKDNIEFIQSKTLDQNEQLGKKCIFTVTDRP